MNYTLWAEPNVSIDDDHPAIEVGVYPTLVKAAKRASELVAEIYESTEDSEIFQKYENTLFIITIGNTGDGLQESEDQGSDIVWEPISNIVYVYKEEHEIETKDGFHLSRIVYKFSQYEDKQSHDKNSLVYNDLQKGLEAHKHRRLIFI